MRRCQIELTSTGCAYQLSSRLEAWYLSNNNLPRVTEMPCSYLRLYSISDKIDSAVFSAKLKEVINQRSKSRFRSIYVYTDRVNKRR